MRETMTENLGGDLLSGITRIAGYLDVEPHVARYWVQTGQVPAFKLASKWTTTKTVLRNYIARRALENVK